MHSGRAQAPANATPGSIWILQASASLASMLVRHVRAKDRALAHPAEQMQSLQTVPVSAERVSTSITMDSASPVLSAVTPAADPQQRTVSPAEPTLLFNLTEHADATPASPTTHHLDSVFLSAATSVATLARMQMRTDAQHARTMRHFNQMEPVSATWVSPWTLEASVSFKAATTPACPAQLDSALAAQAVSRTVDWWELVRTAAAATQDTSWTRTETASTATTLARPAAAA